MQGASKHLDAFVFDPLQLACLPFPPPLFLPSSAAAASPLHWCSVKSDEGHNLTWFSGSVFCHAFLCVLQGEAWLLCLLWGAGCIRTRSAMQLFECIRFLLMPIQAISVSFSGWLESLFFFLLSIGDYFHCTCGFLSSVTMMLFAFQADFSLLYFSNWG